MTRAPSQWSPQVVDWEHVTVVRCEGRVKTCRGFLFYPGGHLFGSRAVFIFRPWLVNLLDPELGGWEIGKSS